MADEPELHSPPPDDPTPPPADAVTTDRGQRLVSVPAAERKRGRPPGSKSKPKTAEFRSLDDVAKKYTAVPRPPAVHTPDATVPPDEPDPARRAGMTVGPIALTAASYDPDEQVPPEARAAEYEAPDLSDGTLRTIEDLNARFDFDGSGQFYIMVNRQKPTHRNGVLTHGRMRNITTALTHEEFCEYYGGGQYQLIVYGPPARGRLTDPFTGKVKPKALSKPISVFVAYEGDGGREPNPLAALEFSHDGDMEMMRPLGGSDMESQLLRRRTNNLADAKMLETSTQKELTMDQRNREDQREDRRERREQEVSALGVLKDTASDTIRVLEQQLKEARDETRRLAANGKSNGSDMEGMAKVLAAIGPRTPGADELDRMKTSYEERIQNLTDTHDARLKDIDERNRRAIEDRERVLVREKEDATRRADDKARYAEEQLASRERILIAERDRERDDARKDRERMITDHTRDLELLKKDHERDLSRQKEHYENLLATERNTNQRDREMLKESLGTKGELMKATVESELRTANSELGRLRADNDRLKSDLEKKSNLPKQLKEFSDAAEGLGFSREEGGGKDEPASWQELVVKGGMTAIERLPEIIKSAGEVIAQRNAAAAAPARPPMRQALPGGAPAAQRPGGVPGPQLGPQAYPVTHVPPMGGWSTEDQAPSAMPLPDQEFHTGLPPAPQAPPPAPMPSAVPPMMPAPPVERPPPMASAPPTVSPPAPRTRRQAEAAAEQQMAPRPPASAQPPTEGAQAIQISDEEILKFAPTIEGWVEAGDASPEEYAQRVMMVQPEIRIIAPVLTPEAVAAALRRAGKNTSPLVRRDGQRFLARFRNAILGATPT